ncbi:hypothetical protein [Streptomyces asiaticus]|uniref:hypothetical protein n=1 Tax=Streptomyces asiaticus TaxID=114695 RepID=UPI003F6800B8
MKLPGRRSGSTGRPAQTRRRDADLSAKNIEEATLEACRTDYVVGAPERAAFDARVRADEPEAQR